MDESVKEQLQNRIADLEEVMRDVLDSLAAGDHSEAEEIIGEALSRNKEKQGIAQMGKHVEAALNTLGGRDDEQDNTVTDGLLNVDRACYLSPVQKSRLDSLISELQLAGMNDTGPAYQGEQNALRIITACVSSIPTHFPDPTTEEVSSPEFNAIWRIISRWDIDVPYTGGRCGATGNHVKAILDAIKPKTGRLLFPECPKCHRYTGISEDFKVSGDSRQISYSFWCPGCHWSSPPEPALERLIANHGRKLQTITSTKKEEK